jgi:hypothetical protein
MRFVPLFLLVALPLAAQVPERRWSLDIHGLPATLEGSFQGKVDGNDIALDLKNDLALTKDKTLPGAGIEYQGHRFGLTLSSDAQDYKGSAVVTRTISLNGQDFPASTRVDSRIKLRSYDLNWTIRVLTWEQAWIGLDLGGHVWDLDMSASGIKPGDTLPTTAAQKITVPIPQAGVSIGGKGLSDRIVGRASFHFLRYKGSSYHRWQGDLRYFPLPWLGVRAFLDDETFDVPKGSIKDDLVLNVDRNGAGFGVVFRF